MHAHTRSCLVCTAMCHYTSQDGFESNEGVIVMAATNLAETLDPALKRPGRFDRQVRRKMSFKHSLHAFG